MINKVTITATPNQSKRTFTIRKSYEDGYKVKYRTIPMSREEFGSSEMMTEKDWEQFLRATNDYYVVSSYHLD